MPRVPHPHHRSMAPWLVVVLAAIAISFALVVIVLPLAAAEPIPDDGPQLFGKVARDKTLLGPWYYGADGNVLFIADDATLPVDDLHVVVYAPNADIHDGVLQVTLVWERAKEVTHEEVVDGQKIVNTTIEYEKVQERAFDLAASNWRLEDTTLDLPTSREDLRVTFQYQNATLFQFTHHTSPILEKTPREIVQEQWTDRSKVLAYAFVLTAVGIALSRWFFTKAGNYVPSFGILFWVFIAHVVFVGGPAVWFNAREWLILKGAPYVGAVYTFFVFVVTLQLWRSNTLRWLFAWIYPNPEASQPHTIVQSILVPPESDDDAMRRGAGAHKHLWLDDSWKQTIYRTWGARTYAEIKDGREWNYHVVNGARYKKLWMLQGEWTPTKMPGFWWQDRHDRERATPDETAEVDAHSRVVLPVPLLGRLMFRHTSVTEVPVTPWAYDEVVMQVIADLHQMGEVATKFGELQVENAQLKSALESETVTKARQLLNEHLRSMYAARLNKPVADIFPEFYERIRRIEPRVRPAQKEPTNKTGRPEEPVDAPGQPTIQPAGAGAPPAGGAAAQPGGAGA